ncbi:hypothetical protein SprV_0602165700 [Sparganum proliferum]
MMICPVIGVADHIGHQHNLPFPPPDEVIVQQVPVSRPRVHPGCPLPYQQAEEGLGHQEAMFCAGSWEKETIVVAAFGSVRTQHFPPGSTACPNAGVRVTEDDQPVRLRYCRQEAVNSL